MITNMRFNDLKIGFAITGSFCTFKRIIPQIKLLIDMGADVVPIMSEMAASTDTRFGTASFFKNEIEKITGREIICTIKDAEPIGPKDILDALIIAPCTGNTLSKIANAMTDSCVSMAAKASLRNRNPLVLAVSTNDGLGAGAKNLGVLLDMKNVYFVPFVQDDAISKPNSLVAMMELIPETLYEALDANQIQPILMESK